MLPAAFVKGYDKRRLRNLLLALFAALAVPTAIVMWQAFDQLKWESWYQYRNQAEALTARINGDLSDAIKVADSRRFGDYAFVSSATASNMIERSPLSAFPVTQDVTGTIGYFQIAPDGRFSTPLVPPDSLQADEAGLSVDELVARRYTAGYITQILAENTLVRTAPEVAEVPGDAALVEEIVVTGSRVEAASDDLEAEEEMPTAGALGSTVYTISNFSIGNSPADYSLEQSVFDQAVDPGKELGDRDSSGDAPARADSLGKVQDLRLDDALERKNETLNRQIAASEPEADTAGRKREQRRESAPRPASPSESPPGTAPPAVITTFASEIDPFEFSMLGSGHMVLYRNAWQDDARFIQGLLLDGEAFLTDAIESAYLNEPLAGMSDLIVSYDDDIIDVFSNALDDYAMSIDGSEFSGALLYRSRLAAPFDRLEMIFSIDHLPPGPGAGLLAWMTALIAIVFVGGFFALYRLGLGQIRLAQQQQDFVSAVSHELKTPLTSIRMYGEMLKEGWADEEKQKQYYEYIHDESERLTRLISNVLQLAKITRSEPQFDMNPVAVGVLMDQVRSKIASQAERAGFAIEVTLDEETGYRSINVDDDCFAQIVINLVDNAIKFSKDAGTKQIDIGCKSDRDGNIVFSVRDYGPGIPKDQLRKIFQLFYRTETELTRETVGTGIGLAIVHQLATAMNGAVDVVNTAPGAEFRVSFPHEPDRADS